MPLHRHYLLACSCRTRRQPFSESSSHQKGGTKSPLLAEENVRGPNPTHVLPHDLENDISEEEVGREEELSNNLSGTSDGEDESDSLGSAAEYEQDLSRKRDLAQILRSNEGPIIPITGPGSVSGQTAMAISSTSNVGVTRSLLSGLSTISHNRRQAHIASEQKRRQSINEGFEDLRRAVPTCSNASDSKAVILRKAVNYINQLSGEVARLKNMLGAGVGSGAPGSPMSPAPMMLPHHPHSHMIYPHSAGHSYGHPMMQQPMQTMPMQSMPMQSMPMQMPMQMHSPYSHPQDHHSSLHPHHHSSQYGSISARQSPGPGPMYPSTTAAAAGGAANRGSLHHLSQYSTTGATGPPYGGSSHPLSSSTSAKPNPLPSTYPTHPGGSAGNSTGGGSGGGGPPLIGATNMSYPANYGAHPGHYGNNHMSSVVSHPMNVVSGQGHGLPLPPAPSGGLPSLKSPHESYNRDDYASAASLSMLRREAPRGDVGSEETKHNSMTE